MEQDFLATYVGFVTLAALIILVLIILLLFFIIRDRKRREEIHDLKNRLNILMIEREMENEEKSNYRG